MRRRPIATLAIALMSVLSSSKVAQAQRFGDWTTAFRSFPLLPGPLGDSARAFLAFSRNDQLDMMGTGGIRFLGGVFHASVGQGRRQNVLGLGYTGELLRHDLGFLGTLGAGGDLSAAYDYSELEAYRSRALRLAVPFSIRWGSPSRFSATPYLAPYAELGHGQTVHFGSCVDFQCSGPVTSRIGQTRAAGLAAGLQLDAWRLGFDLGLRDLLVRNNFSQDGQVTLGLRVRF